jgi:hypothetical protein
LIRDVVEDLQIFTLDALPDRRSFSGGGTERRRREHE